MKIEKNPESYDHDNIVHDDRTIGYVVRNGGAGLTRCPECRKENYAVMVSSGQCAWCGYKLDLSKVEK